MAQAPPPVIDSAKVLMYAKNDNEVLYTDSINLFIGGSEELEWKRLGEVENLAICVPYNQSHEILLLFCNNNWETQGALPFTSIDEAKIKAERGYKGISNNWVISPYSEEEIKDFLRDDYEVDPNSEWWKSICSFCNKDDSKDSYFVKAHEQVFADTVFLSSIIY